jgi:hypothetical protein
VVRWHLERARERVLGLPLQGRPGLIIHGDFTPWNLAHRHFLWSKPEVAVELTPDDLRDIEQAASQITVHGERYPEHLEQQTNL